MRDPRGRARVWWWSQGKQVPAWGSPQDDLIKALYDVESRKTAAQARWLERLALTMGPTSPQTYLEAAKATQAYLDADRREVYDESAATQRVLEQLLAQARRNLQTLEAVERAHRRTRPLKR